MKNGKYRDYLVIGLTAFLVIAAGLLTFFVLFHFKTVKNGFEHIVEILMPFIIGFVIAYLLAPLYNAILRNLEEWLLGYKMPAKTARSAATMTAAVVSIAAALCLLSGLVALVVPSFVTSIMGITESMQSYIDRISLWVERFFVDNPEMAATIQSYLDTGSDQLMTWLTDTLLPSLQGLSGSLSTGVSSVFSVLLSGVLVVFKAAKNVIIGFIVAVYLLLGKTVMIGHCKQVVYGIFRLNTANRIIAKCRYTHQVFGGFLRGKLLDSLIIGVICFVGTSLLKMPYVMLISVIIGVTNIIPFFGPFIGAIPCACLVLLSNPVKCIPFVIFVVALQQFDGNIIGPKILGESTGLSSFWVLFAIIMFGGLFGFVGMIVGVPVFAVIVSLLDGLLASRLSRRQLSSDINDYINLEQVEKQGDIHIYAKLKDPTTKE